LTALGIGPGDEVICPSFTFFATAGSIARIGAVPVFCDSQFIDFNLDIDDLTRRVTPKTKAIIPVHLFGQAARMDRLMDFARDKGIFVIEDAAQAIGAQYQGRQVGGFGDLGVFSFYPTKNLGGFGDAGMVVAQDESLSEKLRLLRNHGENPKYHHLMVGGNFRMDPLQAGLLNVKLPHYQEYLQKRRNNAAYYSKELSNIAGIEAGTQWEGERPREPVENPDPLKLAALRPDMPTSNDERVPTHCILLPTEKPGCLHTWNQYTLRVIGNGKRDSLKAFLTERGIGAEIYYPVPLHRQKCFEHFCVDYRESLPVADELASQVMSIPIFPELTVSSKDQVIESIQDWVKSNHE
ncbi:MAG TPA: DegT/DnrJ/EryC1/StrS family aminotransferase, partial [Verrucomicrobia bacterium]|nr:DegT/DnrJ/EryC1/StrS family aminotransferase [Verrucomicrobiota bacterium]